MFTQRAIDALRIDRELRVVCPALMRELMPTDRVSETGLAIGASRHGWSRARNGDATCPLYRLSSYVADAYLVGLPAQSAQRIADHFDFLIGLLWLSEEEELDLATLSLREQENEGAETLAQLKFEHEATIKNAIVWRGALQRERASEKLLDRSLARWTAQHANGSLVRR